MRTKTPPRVLHFHGTEEHEHPYIGVHNHPWQHLPSQLPEAYIAHVRRIQKLIRTVETRWPSAATLVWRVFSLVATPRSPRQVAVEASIGEDVVYEYLSAFQALGLVQRFPNGSYQHAADLPEAIAVYGRRRMNGAPPMLRGFGKPTTAGQRSAQGPLLASQQAKGHQSVPALSPMPAPQPAAPSRGPGPRRGPKRKAAGGRPPKAAKRSPATRRAAPPALPAHATVGGTGKAAERQGWRVRPAKVVWTLVVLAVLGGVGLGGFRVFEQTQAGQGPFAAVAAAFGSAPEEPPATREEAEARFVSFMKDESEGLRSAEDTVILNYGVSVCERLDEGAPPDKLREASIAAGRPAAEYDAFYEASTRYLCAQHAP